MASSKKGTTLVELMVSLAILSTIMVPISLVFYSGFNNYYIENDNMLAIQKSRETMDRIMEDLRKNDGPSIAVLNDGKTLKITEGIQYDLVTLLDGSKDLTLNGNKIYDAEYNVEVLDFSVEERKPEDYDSKIIQILLKIKIGRSEEIQISNIYRRKY